MSLETLPKSDTPKFCGTLTFHGDLVDFYQEENPEMELFWAVCKGQETQPFTSLFDLIQEFIDGGEHLDWTEVVE